MRYSRLKDILENGYIYRKTFTYTQSITMLHVKDNFQQSR